MKKLSAILLIICLIVSTNPILTPAEEHDDANIFKLLSMLDIMVGDGYGNFYPDNNVTRAEFTKIAVMSSAYRNAVPENSTTSPFGDVPYTLWSAPYITLAVDNGIISGYPDSTFRPQSTVLLEEAVTICLKLLGYTKNDYGNVWPSGPMSLARSLELLENIEKSTGDTLTRRDVMYLIYNTVNTKVKGTKDELIQGLNYTFSEDTVLIASHKEDASITKNKIATSNGTYKIGETLDTSLIGRRGDAFIKNGDTLVAFIPYDQTFETHAVYSVLNDDVIVYKGGSTSSIDVDPDLTCYSGSKTETISSCLSRFNMGDILKLAFDADGDLDYAVHLNNMLEGPYTVKNSSWMALNGIPENASIIKNGKTVSVSEIENSDVIYFSESLGLVWAYDDRITGTYMSASPNQENPSSVVIAGNTYNIESSLAFNKLSSNGSCKLGDTITVLLGKSGGVADVLTDNEDSIQYGYLIETGKKEFPTESGKTETSNYAKVITASGTELEVKTTQDYKETKNQIVSVKIKNGIANLARISNKNKDVSGTVNLKAMLIDNYKLSSNVNILDIASYNDPSQPSGYAKIFPATLDSAELSTADIIYVTQNSKGEIDNMFLNNVTGNVYNYGIVTDMQRMGSGINSSASYTVNLSGKTANYNRAYIVGLQKGHPVAALVSGNTISKLIKLRNITQKISKVENNCVYTADGNIYKFGDNVMVYKHAPSSSNYNSVDLQDVNFEEGSFDYYYYGTLSKSAKIRVIVWTVKNNN